MISDYLLSSGLSQKECDIYLVVARFGNTSCNIVADQLGRERTSTYKLMMSMVQNGFLTISKRGKTVLFSTTDINTIHRQFTQRLNQIQSLDANYDLIKQEYETIIGIHQTAPTVTIAEGVLGISNAYDLMSDIISQSGIIHIKCFASKTFISLSSNNKKLSDLHHGFVDSLDKHGVSIYGLYGQGMETMESIIASKLPIDNMNLPNSNDSVIIRVVGSHVFLFIFKQTPQIIHITSPEFSNLLQFIGEQLRSKTMSNH